MLGYSYSVTNQDVEAMLLAEPDKFVTAPLTFLSSHMLLVNDSLCAE